MLVLSRKKNEQIRIGSDIIVTVKRIAGNRVSIGIEAPPSCRITRGELELHQPGPNCIDPDAIAGTPSVPSSVQGLANTDAA